MEIDNELIYLAGVVAGDGHLTKGVKWKNKNNSRDYGVIIHSNNKDFLEYILGLIKNKIKTRVKVKEGKRACYISVRSKILQNTLNLELDIPLGKKSRKIFIPKNIKDKEEVNHFIAGFFDTDGGFRGNSIGFCSASKRIIKEVSEYLNSINIENSTECWINKKYDKEYYGMKIRKKHIHRFLKAIPLKNSKKLDKISRRFERGCRSGQTG